MSKPATDRAPIQSKPAPHRFTRNGETVYELYLIDRLLEELALADGCEDALERATHLQACRYYREMLSSPEPPEETGTRAP